MAEWEVRGSWPETSLHFAAERRPNVPLHPGRRGTEPHVRGAGPPFLRRKRRHYDDGLGPRKTSLGRARMARRGGWDPEEGREDVLRRRADRPASNTTFPPSPHCAMGDATHVSRAYGRAPSAAARQGAPPGAPCPCRGWPRERATGPSTRPAETRQTLDRFSPFSRPEVAVAGLISLARHLHSRRAPFLSPLYLSLFFELGSRGGRR